MKMEQSQLESNIEKLKNIVTLIDELVTDLEALERGGQGNFEMVLESIELRSQAKLKLARLMMKEVDV